MFGLFNKTKEKIKAQFNGDGTRTEETPELLGLRLGGSVELNDLRLKFIEEHLTFKNAAKIQLIQAVGVVQLDTHSTILRYYTDDNGFFQFVLEGGMTENHINDGKLWFFYDTLGISGEAEWERQLERGISQPTYSVGDQQFNRSWQDMGDKNPPVAMTERTVTEDNVTTETDQFIMLYEREASDKLTEYLMVSGEESINDDQPDRCLVTSTGIDISSADFEVIS